jgi:hypothetical protein
MRERLDPSFVVSSSQITTSVGLVVVRAMIIIVPSIAVFALGAISFLATVADPVVVYDNDSE